VLLKFVTAIVVAALCASVHDDSAIAQYYPPPMQLPPLPGGCAPGTYCANSIVLGGRCQTPQFWCGLVQPLPVQQPCYCVTPYGPINGMVVQ